MAARLLVLDIETIATRNVRALERIAREVIEEEAKESWSKAKRLAWDTEEARRARVEEAWSKTALDPLMAEPVCCCWRADGMGQDQALFDEGEAYREQLLTLAERLSGATGGNTIWIGHNICGFDLPVLTNTWARLGIQPPEHFPKYYHGRWSGRVWDTMLRTPSKNPAGHVSMNAVCEGLGLPGKSVYWEGTVMEGSRVGEAYGAREYELLLRYCAGDVEQEERIYLLETHGDVWNTYGDDPLSNAMLAIETADLSETEKKALKWDYLTAHGYVPRS